MFLVDTNVLSELRKGKRADRNVATWASTADTDQLFISVITVHELELGALRAERSDPPKGQALRRWLEERIYPDFIDRTLAVSAEIAKVSASFHIRDPHPFRDGLIAATALVHDMTVVTRNLADFARTGVRLLNPWEPQSS